MCPSFYTQWHLRATQRFTAVVNPDDDTELNHARKGKPRLGADRVAMGKKGKKSKENKAATAIQVGLKETGLLPKLKAPQQAIGKVIDLPGKVWGSVCAARDQHKIFKVTIVDHSIAHRDDDDG